MTTVIDKKAKKSLLFEFVPMIMFSCFLKNSNINNV